MHLSYHLIFLVDMMVAFKGRQNALGGIGEKRSSEI